MKILATAALAATTGLLRDFQVYPPVLTPSNQASSQIALTNGAGGASLAASSASTSCDVTQTLVEYSFGNSYGQPYVGSYAPPGCDFNRVTLNLTVTSAGVQFDRLALIYLGDTEIWRTSTAEPTRNGIIWTYIKDVSEFYYLLKSPQKLIFDLDNVVDNVYTGRFNVTLQATFFNSPDTVTPADLIIPVSTRQGSEGQASAFSLPSQNATNSFVIPRNVKRAVFSISANGQIDEEFWYSNVLQSDVDTFGPGSLLGYSPFRESQLLIDGKLAGVAWPFPIIFTGGVVPGFWRPIVGIDAFDLREDEIDVSPWLPLLCDGKSHTFEIRIAGIDDDGKGSGKLTKTVGSFWIVTGKLFLWLDKPGAVTTGTTPTLDEPSPRILITNNIAKAPDGTNSSLSYTVNVTRHLSVSSTLKTSTGIVPAVWTQDLSYTNFNNLSNSGLTQLTVQTQRGSGSSTLGYSRSFVYPLTIDQAVTEAADGSITINATLQRGQDISVLGQPVFPTGVQSFGSFPGKPAGFPALQGSHLTTSQNGSAFYGNNATLHTSYSYGATHQDMRFSGLLGGSAPSVELYSRSVTAVNASVTSDDERLYGQTVGSPPVISTRAMPAADLPVRIGGARPGGKGGTPA